MCAGDDIKKIILDVEKKRLSWNKIKTWGFFYHKGLSFHTRDKSKGNEPLRLSLLHALSAGNKAELKV